MPFTIADRLNPETTNRLENLYTEDSFEIEETMVPLPSTTQDQLAYGAGGIQSNTSTDVITPQFGGIAGGIFHRNNGNLIEDEPAPGTQPEQELNLFSTSNLAYAFIVVVAIFFVFKYIKK